MAGVSLRVAAAAAVMAALWSVPCPAYGWSSYRVGTYTLDISLESELEATARLTLEIEVLGGKFRGFKIARGDEGLSWSASAMYCENSSGKRYVLRRVPRADRLTDFRFVTPGFIPRGSATCSLQYEFNPVDLGAIQIVSGQDPGGEDGVDRVRFSYRSPGLPMAVEQFVITLHLPRAVDVEQREIGEFASEEYSVEHFPSALTLRRYRPPAYYTGLVDLILPQEILLSDEDGAAGDSPVGIHHIDRFVGIPPGEGRDSAQSLWMFAVLALGTLLLIGAKHRSTGSADRVSGVRHPYLLFPASRDALRLAASAALLVLYVILAAAGRDAAALLALAATLLLNLRSGLVVDGDRAPGKWSEEDLGVTRRLLSAAGRAESVGRLFLDFTTAPGLALALAAGAGLAALRYVVLVDEPAMAVRLVAAGSVVLSFIFLTSTRLGGWGHLARRTFRRLVSVRREYELIGEDPPPFCLGRVPGSDYPEMRLRRTVATPGPPGGAVIEVGVEWRRGWCIWRGCYAAVVRLDARSGALVAEAEGLGRVEVHTSIEEGRSAIVVRSLDPRLPLFLEEVVRACLAGGTRSVSAADAVRQLHVSQNEERAGADPG